MNKNIPAQYRLYRILWAGIDILFPPTCGGCGKLGERWCNDCLQALTPLSQPACEICGLPQPHDGICQSCQTTRPFYDQMRSWVVFKAPIKHALHELKYKNRRWLGEALAIHLAPQIEKTGWEFDVLIPIPLSQQRRAERGYNQVEQLAQPLSWIGGWNYRPEALSRVKHTQSQVSLSAVERKSNVKGAFSADAKLVSGKTVLLMDDVITTGATVSEAASALKSSGAQKVYAFSLARALKQSDLQEI